MSFRANASNREVTAIASCVIASERAVRLGAKCHLFDAVGAVAERIHLSASEHETHRALQGACRQDREDHVVLRAQAAAEAAADKRRDNPDILGLHLEHAAQIALHVLHALRLVIDRELASSCQIAVEVYVSIGL